MIIGKPVIRYVQIERHGSTATQVAGAPDTSMRITTSETLLFGHGGPPRSSMSTPGSVREDTPDGRRRRTTNTAGSTKEIRSGRPEMLEIGCGWGGFADYAAKTCGARWSVDDQQGAGVFRPATQSTERALPKRSRLSCRTIATSAATTIACAIEMTHGGRRAVLAKLSQLRDRLRRAGRGIQASPSRTVFGLSPRSRNSFSATSFPADACPSPQILTVARRRFGVQ